jgi:hypothetical protein
MTGGLPESCGQGLVTIHQIYTPTPGSTKDGAIAHAIPQLSSAMIAASDVDAHAFLAGPVRRSLHQHAEQ